MCQSNVSCLYKSNFNVTSFENDFKLSLYFIFSDHSMKKMGGAKNKVLLNGCTTDSGGGGTGNSLHSCMDKLGLCVGRESYLVGFCCLHTLQLTLSNAMKGWVV